MPLKLLEVLQWFKDCWGKRLNNLIKKDKK